MSVNDYTFELTTCKESGRVILRQSLIGNASREWRREVRMKYIANPVEVDAFKIVTVSPVPRPTIAELDGILNQGKEPLNGLLLTLDSETVVNATPEMISRMEPVPGDYWVVQSDGYIYLNPKAVFERKYRPA